MRKQEKKEYAIVDADGNYLTALNERGYGLYIPLFTKNNAFLEIRTYYRNKRYKARKMKIR